MIEVKNIIPKALEEVFETDEYSEDGYIKIKSYTEDEEFTQVDLIVSFGGYDLPSQNWRIKITGLLDKKISFDEPFGIDFYSDHFLLYDHIDSYIELYYSSKPDDPNALFVELFEFHKSNYNKYIDFGYGINSFPGIQGVSNGLFARGSKKILEQYAKILNKHGVKCSFVCEKERHKDGLTLMILGDSFFIGNKFYFEKI